MCPPGLGFASPNERALTRAAEAGGPRYYFDWNRTAKGQRKDPPDSPFTPAVSLFMALDVALELIDEEGLDQVYERHRLLGRATRQAVKGLELDLFGPEDENSNVVTAIKLPEGIDGAKVPKTMRDKYGITIAGGQNQLKGKIARIAHCGYYGAFDIVTTVAALEMTLQGTGRGHRARRGRRRGAASLHGSRRARPRVTPPRTRQGEDRRQRRPAAPRRRVRGRAGARLGGRGARAPDRRVRRHAHPLARPSSTPI